MSVIAGIERLHRRIMGALGRGTITTTKDTVLGMQLCQVAINPLETIDNMPRVAEYGFTSHPLPGAHCIVLFAGGERSNGAIIGTGDARYRLASLVPGEVAIYDDLGHVVRLTRTGIVIDGGGQVVTITNAPSVRMETAQLNVTGEIKDHCDSGVDTVEAIRVKYNEHTHSGVHAPFPDPQLPV